MIRDDDDPPIQTAVCAVSKQTDQDGYSTRDIYDVGNIGDKTTNTSMSDDTITIANCGGACGDITTNTDGGGDTMTNTVRDGDTVSNTNKDWITNGASNSSAPPSDVVRKAVTDKQKDRGLQRSTQSKNINAFD
ncbi:hypothetical protein GN244_ATG00603 [Phytophthora infestans]|uniref:Uncharacterized protein n=1 Tax=Phytophthora infestans TaxID=4787 RepID=A0A833WQJ3_PHYIN|nr:hypothetical protein GN244_ATG00603 [Phytophthora infestans]KAF4127244.1 hypothetical protein GN958_ATG23558 [Phytophthora infestans]